jgi:uncharacterized protein YdeI (YjbR/CyaY-like superfamily)
MLKRQKQDMPIFIEEALIKASVMDDYLARPAYQQNDYLAWIKRAAREDTKQKRLNQMIEELKKGSIYMKMNHQASIKDNNEK